MNLHDIVRPAIGTVNQDRPATLLASAGTAVNADYSQTPAYAPPVNVKVQIQPLSRGDLKLFEKLNQEGVCRTVYMYGNTQGIVRVQAKNGDLLQFSTFQGEAVQTWKIANVSGPWNVNAGGWTKLIVVLQTDGP